MCSDCNERRSNCSNRSSNRSVVVDDGVAAVDAAAVANLQSMPSSSFVKSLYGTTQFSHAPTQLTLG